MQAHYHGGMDTIADRFQRALTLRGTYAHTVSEAAGLSRATGRYLLDHPDESPKVRTLAALAGALRVDPAWLAFGAPYPAPHAGEARAPEVPPVPKASRAPGRQPPPARAPEVLRRVQDHMKRGGLSQRALARATGVPQSVLSAWFSGRAVSDATLSRVRAWLPPEGVQGT